MGRAIRIFLRLLLFYKLYMLLLSIIQKKRNREFEVRDAQNHEFEIPDLKLSV